MELAFWWSLIFKFCFSGHGNHIHWHDGPQFEYSSVVSCSAEQGTLAHLQTLPVVSARRLDLQCLSAHDVTVQCCLSRLVDATLPQPVSSCAQLSVVCAQPLVSAGAFASGWAHVALGRPVSLAVAPHRWLVNWQVARDDAHLQLTRTATASSLLGTSLGASRVVAYVQHEVWCGWMGLVVSQQW